MQKNKVRQNEAKTENQQFQSSHLKLLVFQKVRLSKWTRFLHNAAIFLPRARLFIFS